MPEPASIQLLPDAIINKIAAGEVVDRPASVVKELVENAVDAGATQIEISIVDGGLKLISIADNGHGMDRDNALLAVERHATSKIRHVDDIEKINTLGFRGEALAAIASVSRFALTTRREEEVSGTEVRINGGRMEDVGETGCPPGTQIVVRNLFFNVPARRKFLKTAATELSHIRQVFMLYALGRPDIGLRLVVDEKEVYRLDADSQLEDRIRSMYGPALMNDLKTVDWGGGVVRISGLISSNRLHRGDRSEQYIFVNGRPASAPVLGYALSETYKDLLPRGRFPVVFLFIDLPPEDVDVNVHPTKKEVRFRRAAPLRDAVIQALSQALLEKQKPEKQPDHSAGIGSVSTEPKPPAAGGFLRVADLPALPSFDYPGKVGAEGLTAARESSGGEREATPPESPFAPTNAPWHWCRILGQIANYYVILETDEGMIVMDPQAAHERVLYERLMRQAEKKIETQGLLVPETVHLSPVRAAVIKKHIEVFSELGFGISDFGGDTVMLDALPATLGELPGEALLHEIADRLEGLGKSGLTRTVLRETIVQAAAVSAVRSTTQLSREELEKLIADLSLAELPYTSPRGRPTLIFTSLQELKKKFGR